ncbi:VOC family protein [Cellulomonas bogoriensis]|uniref:VOC family protein n=1 Tax=Cellulomonas bogoriensis TaxID=301388 RepID=UPI00068DF032|nr:VOC family protein [Cellulomonas bogoriensis]
MSATSRTDGRSRAGKRLARYEGVAAPVMMVLAIVFLAAYGVPIVWPDVPSWVHRLTEGVAFVIWVAFAADLLTRVALTDRRLRYLLRHPVDVAAVLLPMLRPLRVLRVFASGQVLLARGRGVLRSGQALVFSAGTLVLIGALAILDAERDAEGANITTFGDALWWAITTVTTVGYGDRHPVTGVGRGVAAALMIVGISLLGVVTASFAAWFLAGGDRTSDDSREDDRADRPERPTLRATAVTIAAPDPRALARFYARLLDGELTHDDPPGPDEPPTGGWAQVRTTGLTLNVEHEARWRAPVWPARDGEQVATVHLDVQVDDLPGAVRWAQRCGARLADVQPQDDVRVMLDPAGHPFCLFT